MPRSPLARLFKTEMSIQQRAAAQGVPPEAVREELRALQEARQRGLLPPVSRRRFLTGVGALGASSAAALTLGRSARAAQPRIAILGGGLSGLAAALELSDRGYASTIYEANPMMTGGRCQSDRGSAQAPGSDEACGVCHVTRRSGDDGAWDDGQVTDMFGEMIDTGHTVMLSLADRFGLDTVDMLAAEPSGSTETYHFGGSYYAKADADDDFASLYRTIHSDLTSAGYPTTWDSYRAGGAELDALSIYDWIETRVPDGHANPLGALLDVAYNIEFGAECTDQSSLSLIYLLGYGPHRELSVFGESDERYRISGGVGQIPQAMTEAVGADATIRLGYWLESIRRASDGTYVLTFDVDGGGVVEVVADIVIMTLPFAVLRNLDYADAGFDDLKDQAIQELGRGVNGKLQLQFTRRAWNDAGAWGLGNGTAYSDVGCQSTWEPTRGVAGDSGILLKYTGGDVTRALNQDHPYRNALDSRVLRDAEGFLDELDVVFPGVSSAWNGKAAGAMPHRNERFGCSYSYWRVGQYTTFAGYEGERQGNVFFAGEHTCYDYQGWMEGAVRSGQQAAADVVSAMRGRGSR